MVRRTLTVIVRLILDAFFENQSKGWLKPIWLPYERLLMQLDMPDGSLLAGAGVKLIPQGQPNQE